MPNLLLGLGVLGAALAGAPARAQSGQPDVRITITPVRGNVHLLTGSAVGSVNAAVSVGPDGVLLVDGLLEGMAEQIELELRRLTVAPVRWIVNTHWHGDHTGANVRFGHGAVILAHANTRSRLMIEQRPPWEPVPVPALPAHAWPDIAITEPTTIYVNGEPIDLLPMPFGHSDGDLVVHFTWSRVASVGDLVVFRDGEMRPAPSPWSGGDAARLAAHLDTLTRRLPPDVIVLPGHGPPLTRADLEASSGLLKAILGVVRSRLAAGWSIERATSDAMPPEVTARLPWRISEPAWLQVVGQSLASPKRPSP